PEDEGGVRGKLLLDVREGADLLAGQVGVLAGQLRQQGRPLLPQLLQPFRIRGGRVSGGQQGKDLAVEFPQPGGPELLLLALFGSADFLGGQVIEQATGQVALGNLPGRFALVQTGQTGCQGGQGSTPAHESGTVETGGVTEQPGDLKPGRGRTPLPDGRAVLP